MVSRVLSEKLIPAELTRPTNSFEIKESCLQYSTTTPQSKGPIIAAALPESEYKPKNCPVFWRGIKLAIRGREAVQVEPRNIPVKDPRIQKSHLWEVKETRIKEIIQPQTTKERVFLGPILSVTQPHPNEPRAAEVVETANKMVFSLSVKPITA